MGKRVGGNRRKTRHKLKQSIRKKGKLRISDYLRQFKKGEKVNLVINPRVHKGTFHPRFMGKTGTIIGKRGSCYEIRLIDKGKEKTVIAHPIHLKKV